MSTSPTTDPMSFMRDMLNQWEQMGNQMGSKLMESKEFAQVMHQGTAASLQAQTALQEGMAKALAAANIPSKADIDALGARMLAVEKQLMRIEAKLGNGGDTTPDKPKPSRNRQPPKAAE